SSTDSVCMSHEKPGDYRHNLWLPRQLPGQPEQPGLLRATAYLNREGFATNSGSVMDRYHYRTASGVANFAYHGFTPVLQAIGMDVSCRVRSVYHDRQCQVDVAFSSAERTAELCNDLLERSGENLRLVVLPPGRYDSATFINLMAGRRYPLSQEYATHDQESGVLEPGSHDVLQHVPVIMALAGTQALGRVQERAQALVDGSALGNYQGEADRQRLRKQFMGEVDGTLNGIIMSEVLQGDPEAKRKFARVLGLYSTDSVDPYLEEVLDNIRRPEVTGRLVLPS
ncbi:MAG TPA: hypothetical protein VFM05_01840, partial [Candidatus Saccharimonadales bacterium]|nr:hypothetical protein [Candidatus Saccharimonadales bacterium]